MLHNSYPTPDICTIKKYEQYITWFISGYSSLYIEWVCSIWERGSSLFDQLENVYFKIAYTCCKIMTKLVTKLMLVKTVVSENYSKDIKTP